MRETSVPMQCWCDVGRSSERRKSAQLQVLHEQLFGAFVRSFCTGLAIPCDRPTTARILKAGLAAFSPPPSHPTLFLMLRCPHCPSLPRLEQPVRAQDRRFQGLKKCPGSSSTASARERHQPPTLARRQPASRAAPLGALGRRSAMREPGGVAVGVSVRFSQVVGRRQRPW